MNAWWLLLGWVAAGGFAWGSDQGVGIWRVFGTSDGFPVAPAVALSVSPRGSLWVLHGSEGGVSAFDGYSVRRLTEPPPGGGGVAENRTGQIWSLNREGILEWRRDGWRLHPVEELRRGLNSDPPGERFLAPYLPAERNNLLILLPETLLKFDTFQESSSVVASAGASGLGVFLDICEARDGGVWIVGEQGVARVAGPVRRVVSVSDWRVTPVPEGEGLRLVGRAFEAAEGGLVVMAAREGGQDPLALLWDGDGWAERTVLPEGSRRAWQGPGRHLWALANDRLWIQQGADWDRVVPPGWEEARLHDVIVQGDGSFWVGSSVGVARYAEAQWQSPETSPVGRLPILSMANTPEGSLWFAATDRLFRMQGENWEVVELGPYGMGSMGGGLHALPAELVFLEGTGRLGLADSLSRLRTQEAPPGWRVSKILGKLDDGRLLVQLARVGRDAVWRLDTFDGGNWAVFFEPPADWALGGDLSFAYTSRGGALWLGTGSGLALWNGRERAFKAVESYSFGAAVSLVDVGGGRLWCCSGRDIIEGDGRSWWFLRPSPGVVERLVMLRDGGIWALGGGKIRHYYEGSWIEHQGCAGLPEGELYDLGLDNRGRLWVATEEGVRLYRPEADMDPPRSRVVSTGGRRVFSTGERVALLLQGVDRWSYAPAELLAHSTRLNEGAWSPYRSSSILVLTNLTAGAQRLEVRSMDPAYNEEPDPAVFEFTAFVPWYREPRIVAVTAGGVLVALVLAGLAINRHLRLVRSYAEVERMVEQRTRELERANEELVHSQKMRALGTLAAGIAHDFNSILSIIKGSAQIIENALEDPVKIRTRVDRIKKMVEQGAGIVRAMLGLSRTSRQDWRTVKMPEFLEETVRLVVDQVPHGVGLHLDPAAEVPPVKIATDLFRQLLLNLILNAGEAMSDGGEILLRCWLGDKVGNVVLPPATKGAHVVVEVLDTGRGIEPEILPRIFEPFFTTKAFSTRKGTGLGLTMVHEIAREMGVGLGVESSPGQGTIFRIYVPLEDRR